jgi:hypothetical protein
MTMEHTATSHPPDEQIAAYLSGALSRGEREAVEAHLGECHSCRTHVTAVQQLLRARPAHSRRILVASLAAAAVLAGVLLVPRPHLRPPGDADRAGGAGEPGLTQTLHAITPADGDTVSRSALRFTWRSEPGEPLYRLTITTARGEALWSHDTNDTTLAAPADIRLTPNARYFWYVDALDASGQSLTTGPRTVWIAP